MKKTMILICSLIAATVSAQVKLPDFPNGERSLGFDVLSDMPRRTMGRDIPFVETEPLQAPVGMSGVAPRIVKNGVARKASNAITTVTNGYLNPAGTLFLGLDEAGKGTWFKNGGIVGAWSDSIDHWKFEQTISGSFDSVVYTNKALKLLASEFEDTKFFYQDKEHNWYDSLVASGGYEESYELDIYGDNNDYPWPKDMPLQTIYRKDTTESFMLLCSDAKPTVNAAGYIVGGLPSSNTADGLWPLTNAVNIARDGVSINLIATTDEDAYVHYIFGSDSLNVDTVVDPSGSVHYSRLAPVSIVTKYDKPQAPLYVKSISVAMGAKGSSQARSTIQIDQLKLNVKDKDGNIIASSSVVKKDLKKISYASMAAGRMVTFLFDKVSDEGDALEPGFLVADEFSIEITNISKDDVFGLYCAKSSLRPSHSYTLYEGEVMAEQDYDPYIMLNGIYNTFENYALNQANRGFMDIENSGDTIPVNMITEASPYYKYRGYYAAKDLREGNIFEYYSTFMPYDSVSRYWLMDVEKPEYIELGCDYDTNYGTEDNPINLWNIAHCFDLFIYATDTPHIGDIISVSKCGRHAVFRIREIDGTTDMNQIQARAMLESVQKRMDRNGMVRILRGNKQYSILGQPIY
ncbi:MAG: hypothetical protein MJZ75_06965 [Paludibacteraceae bacterium]|nr:hypothetical protein [Paludibacteraceae bacterium]